MTKPPALTRERITEMLEYARHLQSLPADAGMMDTNDLAALLSLAQRGFDAQEREAALREAVEALTEIAQGRYGLCPFDDPDFNLPERTPCPTSGDIDETHWPEGPERDAIIDRAIGSHCHTLGVSSRARAAIAALARLEATGGA